MADGSQALADLYEVERSLLQTLSDDLALPLLHVKTTMELIEEGRLPKSLRPQLQTISLSAAAGLQLLEAYRLALSHTNHQQLPLEPVAVGAILQDVAHELTPFAKQYATELAVDIRPGLRPVLANQTNLLAAMHCLGISFIRTQAAQDQSVQRRRLVFGAHRSSNQTVTAGLFGDVKGLSEQAIKAARNLSGQAKQPLPAVPLGSAGGVLVADLLCSAIWQPLRSGRHNKLRGLVTDFMVSKQMQLV